MTLGLFKFDDYPDKTTQAKSGMAHFSGGGPAGATCGKCAFYGSRDFEKKCTKYREMAHDWGTNIKPATAACKYFEPKPGRP